jgi:hypothetical protein
MGERNARKPEFMPVAKPVGAARSMGRFRFILAAIAVFAAAPAYAADFNQTLKSPTPWVVAQTVPPKGAKGAPPSSPVSPNAAGADAVNKLLANPPSDPDVPLPRRDLTPREAGDGALEGSPIYGRREDGGAVFGLKVPIPADRGSSDHSTRSSSYGSAPN